MSDGDWYFVQNGQTRGPVNRQQLLQAIATAHGPSTLVWGPGVPEWTEARHIAGLTEATASTPPPPPSARPTDDLDFEIHGDDMQFVELTLDPGETVIAEAGGMLYMTRGIDMQTVFGDPNRPQQDFFGKLLDAGKRLITGESLFLTVFATAGSRREQVAFAAPYPGKIIPLHLNEFGGELICQKDSFLCAARGISIGIAFQKKVLTGLFGGEGFILQRLTGDGIAFLHAGGTIHRMNLSAGEELRVDTGCLVAFQPSVQYDVQSTGGIMNSIFGGEGLFLTTLHGPGAVWLQSLPFTRLAGRVLANAGPRGRGKDEGSLLGPLGSLFESRQ